MRLHSESFGAGPAVILLHGGGSSMMAWDEEVCEALAARGRLVVRVDGRGAGQSPAGSAECTLRDLANDIVELLDALGLHAATLVGVSLGGIIAQVIAVEHPERVAGLVLISTTPGGEGLPGPADGLFDDEPEAPDWSDRAAVVRYLVEVERPWAAGRFDEALLTRIAARTVDHAADLPAQLGEPPRIRDGEPVRDRLGGLEVPTVVIQGTRDPMYPPEHGRALAGLIPGARLLELDFGHATLPRDLWPELIEAITSLPAAPPGGAGPAPPA